MLNQNQHPVAWALLIYELTDAREHLDNLIQQMSAGAIDDEVFAVDLGHVFAHLNRAWHGRNDSALADLSQSQHKERSRFPSDLKAVG
jgi:hypothetical protein